MIIIEQKLPDRVDKWGYFLQLRVSQTTLWQIQSLQGHSPVSPVSTIIIALLSFPDQVTQADFSKMISGQIHRLQFYQLKENFMVV